MVSISQTFYKQLFVQKCFLSSFLLLSVWLCNFLTQKNIGTKAACKMLVKLTLSDSVLFD